MNRLIQCAAACAVLCPTLAAAANPDAITDPHPTAPTLGVFTSLGYLGSPGGNGSAFDVGLRLGVGRHFALSFDAGYGVLATGATIQDRWWLMPSMAVVIPARIGGLRTSFDVGAGVGLGASSGYVSWTEYVDKPFMPVWAFQLVPTVRVHALASIAVNRNVDMFLRADAASLVLLPRAGVGVTDTTWLTLSLGAHFRML